MILSSQSLASPSGSLRPASRSRSMSSSLAALIVPGVLEQLRDKAPHGVLDASRPHAPLRALADLPGRRRALADVVVEEPPAGFRGARAHLPAAPAAHPPPELPLARQVLPLACPAASYDGASPVD